MPGDRRLQGRAGKNLLSAQSKREAAPQLQKRGFSQRRSCALCRISRSSFAYLPSTSKARRDHLLGQRLKGIQAHTLHFLTITDECTRQSLAVVAATSIRSQNVVEVLKRLFAEYGTPRYLRSDNEPEFVSRVVRDWLKQQGVQTAYIELGCPWQNGFAESFHSRFRDECLNREWLHHIREAKVLVKSYRRYYNHERPHSTLGYKTPFEFLAA